MTNIDHACTGHAETVILAGGSSGEPIVTAQGTTVDARVRDALVRVLREGVDVHRCLAAQALGRSGDKAAVEPLIEALLDEDEDVRTDAAEALVQIDDDRAAKPLLENLLGDPCSEVKMAAMAAVARFRPTDALPMLRSLASERSEDIVWDEEELYQAEWDSWADLQPKAIAALAAYGDRSAVPLIVAALNDEDGQDLRGVGFEALSRLGDEGVQALAGFLQSPEERTRMRAAGHIASLPGPIADAAAGRALGDPSSEVVLAAATALAGRDPHDARLVPVLDDAEPRVRAEIVRLCGAAHPDRIEDWLADDIMPVRAAALRLIADQPLLVDRDAGVDLARANLANTPLPVFAAAMEALAALSRKDARDEIEAIVEMPNISVEARLTALRVLLQVATNGTVPILKALLGAEHRPVRIEAMAVLAKLARRSRAKVNRAERVLISALNGSLFEPETETAETVEAGSGRGEAAAAPPEDAFETESDDPKTGEDPAVGGPADEDAPPPTSTLDAIMGANARELEASETREVDLDEDDIEFMRLAASGGGKRRVAPAAPVPHHQDVPRLAARLLGDVPHAESVSALADMLGSTDHETRVAAADSLGRSAEAGATLTDDAVEALRRCLPGADRELRPTVVRALGYAHGSADKVAMALIGALEDEDHLVRIEAIRALVRLGECGPGIERLLDDTEPGVRLAAAEALAASDGDAWLDRLVAMTFENEGYHRRDIARLLRTIDPGRASAALVQALDDPSRQREWAVAIEALDELNQKQENGSDAVMA